MHYLDHSGIALATSLVSWIGSFIYLVLLIKKRKILKFKFNLELDESNLLFILIYALKLFMTSFLMILFMKITFYILNIYKLNEIYILLSLVLIGFLTYFLTNYFLKYIPQELLIGKVIKLRK